MTSAGYCLVLFNAFSGVKLSTFVYEAANYRLIHLVSHSICFLAICTTIYHIYGAMKTTKDTKLFALQGLTPLLLWLSVIYCVFNFSDYAYEH